MAEPTGSKLAAGFDPRRRIERDRFNEYFVFLLSSVGAAVFVPVVFLIAQALSEKWNVGVFLVASVLAELLLIFGLGRPAMKPLERVGWALLWGFAALAFGAAFYYLVVEPVL